MTTEGRKGPAAHREANRTLPPSFLPYLSIHSKSASEAWGEAAGQQSGEGPGPRSLNLSVGGVTLRASLGEGRARRDLE